MDPAMAGAAPACTGQRQHMVTCLASRIVELNTWTARATSHFCPAWVRAQNRLAQVFVPGEGGFGRVASAVAAPARPGMHLTKAQNTAAPWCNLGQQGPSR